LAEDKAKLGIGDEEFERVQKYLKTMEMMSNKKSNSLVSSSKK